MRIAVIGAGGVGGYFGGRLAQAGESVLFVVRGRTLKALRTDGLKIESPRGDVHLQTVEAVEELGEPVDLILIGVKAWQVRDVARKIQPWVAEKTAVLPLQNGVDAPTRLAEVLGGERVLGGLCKIISRAAEPGVIQHLGAEPFIEFGELTGAGEISPRVERIAETLSRAGITVEVSNDIRVAMWLKFLFIASVSGIGAVTRVPIGTFRELPETRAMLRQSLTEIRDVGLAQGLNLPDDCLEKTLLFIDTLPPEGTASMQRDIMEGRPSELESQNGAVVRWAEKVGVEVPINRFLYHSLLPMERKARGL